MWGLPGPGIGPASPASAGGLFTTELHRSPQHPAFAFGSSGAAAGTSRGLFPRICPECARGCLQPHVVSLCSAAGRDLRLSGSNAAKRPRFQSVSEPADAFFQVKGESVSRSVVSDSLGPHGLYSPPGSSVHGILQARILAWVAIPPPWGSSRRRDGT